jgi:hypothetical protein
MSAIVNAAINLLVTFDFFAPSVSFKLNGKDNAKNIVGSILGLGALIGALILAIPVFEDYINGANPSVVQNTIYGLNSTNLTSRNLFYSMSFYHPVENSTSRVINKDSNNQAEIFKLYDINISCTTCNEIKLAKSQNTRMLQSVETSNPRTGNSGISKLFLCNEKYFANKTLLSMNKESSEGVLSIFRNYSFCLPDRINGTIENLIDGKQDTSFQMQIPYNSVPVDFSKLQKNVLGAPVGAGDALGDPNASANFQTTNEDVASTLATDFQKVIDNLPPEEAQALVDEITVPEENVLPPPDENEMPPIPDDGQNPPPDNGGGDPNNPNGGEGDPNNPNGGEGDPNNPSGGDNTFDPNNPNGGSDPNNPSGGSDPFSPSGGSDPFSPSGGSDPFSPSGGSDPFSPSGGSDPFSPSGGSDPFSPSGGSDPFNTNGDISPTDTSGGSDPFNTNGDISPTETSGGSNTNNSGLDPFDPNQDPSVINPGGRRMLQNRNNVRNTQTRVSPVKEETVEEKAYKFMTNIFNSYKFPKMLIMHKDLDINPGSSKIANDVYKLEILDYSL